MVSSFPPPLWAVLQFALVGPALLAGWTLLRRTRLWEVGYGGTRLLESGARSALVGFGRGMLIAVPWSLGLVVLGSGEGEDWVQRWWQPFVAIQPGIAEEAWGRVLRVPLLFIFLRPSSHGRTALTAAVVMGAYWFGHLHTAGSFEALISTVMIGTLFALPTSCLWLHEGLETAIGWHFWLDFVEFLAALALGWHAQSLMDRAVESRTGPLVPTSIKLIEGVRMGKESEWRY